MIIGTKNQELNIQQNISLKPYNTFGIDVSASRFVSVDNLDKLQKILTQEKDVFLLGATYEWNATNYKTTNDKISFPKDSHLDPSKLLGTPNSLM